MVIIVIILTIIVTLTIVKSIIIIAIETFTSTYPKTEAPSTIITITKLCSSLLIGKMSPIQQQTN
jgi:hypothetical protein